MASQGLPAIFTGARTLASDHHMHRQKACQHRSGAFAPLTARVRGPCAARRCPTARTAFGTSEHTGSAHHAPRRGAPAGAGALLRQPCAQRGRAPDGPLRGRAHRRHTPAPPGCKRRECAWQYFAAAPGRATSHTCGRMYLAPEREGLVAARYVRTARSPPLLPPRLRIPANCQQSRLESRLESRYFWNHVQRALFFRNHDRNHAK